MKNALTITGYIVRMGGNPPSVEIELWPRNTVTIQASQEVLCNFSTIILYKKVVVKYTIDKHGYPNLVDIKEAE